MAERTKSPTEVTTGKDIRFSYANVFVATIAPGSTIAKFSTSLIWKKTNKAFTAVINAAVEAAKKKGVSDLWKGKLPPVLKMPVRDGDVDRPDDANYAGCYFMNASSTTRPGVVDENKQEILNKDDFYSGCYGRANINFYAFDKNGSKGIACGLNHVQKIADGDRLGSGRPDIDDAFGDDDGDIM